MSTSLTAATTGARGARQMQWIAAAALVFGCFFATDAAYAQESKPKLSSDLSQLLTSAATGADVPSTTDVIVSGNDAFVKKMAGKYGATVKKDLETHAVLTVSTSALAAMANDAEVGTLASDGILRSQLALVTESTGAVAAWEGDILKLGSVTGKGIG